ncbi:alpha/beta hydrolase [Pseudomonas aeruginosa]|uniref:esterase/lipase family protein n=1 Tax=Pseudomonas aeruginosa TaxID=287 RepID=UPI002649049A|nr:alpha/beta hydrolase [Pseudomonas aeruginosa]WKD91992.1 alpha/beta hydrolase [Pseudomonas aeruginosa]
MPRSIVIVHGWSDDSKSFRRLAEQLEAWFGSAPTQIRLADWISLQDDVTYADLAAALDRAWTAQGLSRAPRTVDVVVHSTGALVLRDWLTRHFDPASAPVKRFLMLAPANFGSPLAHKGRSFIGCVLKGWNRFVGQTGTQVLKGLELGSPYSWQLAERDLFGAEAWYGAGRLLATVLVGNAGYSGVEAIANEAGGDGTVRIATANLNACRLSLELDVRQRARPGWRLEESRGEIAFAIVDGENHASVALKDRGPKNPHTLELIRAALEVEDADYRSSGASFPWQRRIDQLDPGIERRSPRYLNLVSHVCDDLDQEVRDYFIQFFRKLNSDRRFEQRFYEQVIADVHPYEDNPAYRSLYLSIESLDDLLAGFAVDTLSLSVSAQPPFDPPRQPVGYTAVGPGDSEGLAIPLAQVPRFLAAHRTLLLRIRLTRLVDSGVFVFRNP